jgi:DNA-binding transcriptional MerR regulator
MTTDDRTGRDWSIQEIARLAGTTSRTLRHYDDIGLLRPSRIAANGYRHYDQGALVRLQRILLLRDLGLGLPAIADVLAGQHDTVAALAAHREWLVAEQDRLARQIDSVDRAITATRGGEQLMAEEILDGFDHTVYKDEVEERWGADAYARSDAWWRGLGPAKQAEYAARSRALMADWTDAASRGLPADGEEAQALAQRQYDGIIGIPGLPVADAAARKAYFSGLGDMYVADPRFAKNYGGQAGAEFVRDAMKAYAAREL